MNAGDNDDAGISFPVGVESEYVTEHNYVTRVEDASPISEAVISEFADKPLGLYEYPLAGIQAVCDRHIDDIDEARLVTTQGDTEYYVVNSVVFFKLAVLFEEAYPDEWISIEELHDIVSLHTIQYLSDVHRYEGDFEGFEPTLCNAYNDPRPGEGAVLSSDIPEEVSYGFTDSRGLIVQRGTHTSQ